ncbi:MAG: OmpA family protein [Crocinitomicaceae bacterium]|nr:OmpA family protein [Crocinitomicaceae bacterium]
MNRYCFTVLFAFCLAPFLHAQQSAGKYISTAEKNVKKLDYSAAVAAYKSALTVEPKNKKALQGLVDIYMNTYQLYDSAFVYINRQLATIEQDTNYLIYYNYANCLRLMEEHEKAIEQYKFFKKYGLRRVGTNHPLIAEVDKSINYSVNAIKNQQLIYEPFEVENMDFFINSVETEYTPVYIEDDNLLLYNARYKDYDTERRDMDNKFFENIYYFDLEESVASTYNPSIDQKTHQCVVGNVFDSDSILVFYQNRVWVSTMTEDRLNKLQPLPAKFGSFFFQPHGVFSKDQKTFIFTARSEFGNLDIYISHLEDTAWTDPKPISPYINTAEDEDGPFLSADGKTLYFSSRGHNSSGGYDFYMSKKVDGRWTIPTNLGYPMNSAGDDIYITWNRDERSGFFSSNRSGGFGGMDIYMFGLVKKTIKGTATDLEGEVLAGVKVELKELETETVQTVITEDDGTFAFLVDPEKKFEISGNKEKYFPDMNSVSSFGEDDVFVSDLKLEKDPGISLFLKIVDAESQTTIDSVKIIVVDNMIDTRDSIITDETGIYHIPLPDKKLEDRGSYNFTLIKEGYLTQTITYNVLFDREGKYNVFEDMQIRMEKIEVGVDLTDIIDLQPIYFDYNKAIIRPDAAIELDKIVKVMNDNPNMRIELGSHTDARGSAKDNQRLSEKRAQASVKYIKERITNPDRITGKGYGESQLVNGCADGVECSEVEHQENRRTEFIILEM